MFSNIYSSHDVLTAPKESYVSDLQMLEVPIVNNTVCSELNDKPDMQVGTFLR